MCRRVAILILAAVLSFSVTMRAADDLVLSRFGDYVDSLRTQAGIPGLAATLVTSTDVIWERTFGLQDLRRNIAVRSDTPVQIDGITQIVVATMALRCVEEGRLSLDDPIGQLDPDSTEPSATWRQLLTHTTAGPDGLVFSYRPERLAPLALAVSACSDQSFRGAVAGLLDRMAMIDSVPGADAVDIPPDTDGFDAATLQRYGSVLARLATPYLVDTRGRTSPAAYVAPTLTPAGGLISTARDLAKFDVALKKGVIVHPSTLALAWTAPLDRSRKPLPHGMGWFVQQYNGEPIVWQFGVTDNAWSSLVLTAPRRGLTLILLANSQGLARPFPLAAGDVTT
jgi:CubicO group peptidase (beta-lactamase class C family)